nr:hexosyltransferase GAUT11-like [Lolium perenne]
MFLQFLVLNSHVHVSSCSSFLFQNKGPETEEVSHEKVNFTEELLSSTSFARKLADQMTLAKAYVILAKEHGNLQLAWELSSQIRNRQRLLSEGAVSGRATTQEEAHPIITRLARLIYKSQDSHYDISTTIVTLKSHALALEERAKAAVVQTAEFGQIAAESLPKNLHCLTVKLTEEWLQNPELRSRSEEHRNSTRLVDNNLYHFSIFSDNVLATSVVVNSTVSNANHPQQLVFHVVTDRINFGAMSTWLLVNDFKGCTVEVRCIDEFSWLNAASSPLARREMETRGYYNSGGSKTPEREIKFHNPKFASLLNHLRFYIPQILPNLEKVVFLDDDVVVQKDLTQLFSIELHDNVIGAVETCLESIHRYHKYLNFSQPIISSKIDPRTCGWAFGMNIFDLIAWRKANATALYHYWQEQNADQLLWRTGTLPAGLLTFYGLMEPLDWRWHVLGLGYDVDIDDRLIESAVVHYNGNMKPWLKLAIRRYRSIWERYVNSSHPYVRECMFH